MSLKTVVEAVVFYRLKYSVQRPYPGRWTTPLVLVFFICVTTGLAFLNISLAGQDIVQEFTAQPNDTSSDLPFRSFIPSVMRPSAGDFLPTTFKVGDVLQTNVSLFKYEIISAFDEKLNRSITPFPWSNNPMSSCDVSEIHVSLGNLSNFVRPQLAASVYCWFPIRLMLVVSFADISDLNGVPSFRNSQTPELLTRLYAYCTLLTENVNATFNLLAVPCCDCAGNPAAESHLNMSETVMEEAGWLFQSVGHPTCDDNIPTRFSRLSGRNGPPARYPMFVVQVFYHLLRLDLGVIRPNQIFTSADVFNKTMGRVSWDDEELVEPHKMPSLPQEFKNASLDVAVPKAVYLRPRFRPKPLPSAITSVFVATITMVTAVWKVFSLIAGFFVDSLDGPDRARSIEMMEEGDGSREELLRATRR